VTHGIGITFSLKQRISESYRYRSVAGVRGLECGIIAPNEPLIRGIVAITKNPTAGVSTQPNALIYGLGVGVVKAGVLEVQRPQ
jgi:hypothetical protein